MEIGKIISRLRQEKGYTQEKLAGLLDITTSAISKWESGNAYPDITLIPKIAEIFDVSVDYLFDRAERLNQSVEDIIAEANHKDPERAIEFLSVALERYPNNSRLTYELAWYKCIAAKKMVLIPNS